MLRLNLSSESKEGSFLIMNLSVEFVDKESCLLIRLLRSPRNYLCFSGESNRRSSFSKQLLKSSSCSRSSVSWVLRLVNMD